MSAPASVRKRLWVSLPPSIWAAVGEMCNIGQLTAGEVLSSYAQEYADAIGAELQKDPSKLEAMAQSQASLGGSPKDPLQLERRHEWIALTLEAWGTLSKLKTLMQRPSLAVQVSLSILAMSARSGLAGSNRFWPDRIDPAVRCEGGDVYVDTIEGDYDDAEDA